VLGLTVEGKIVRGKLEYKESKTMSRNGPVITILNKFFLLEVVASCLFVH